MQKVKKNGCFPDLDRHLKERDRKLVNYQEVAEFYSLGGNSFCNLLNFRPDVPV